MLLQLFVNFSFAQTKEELEFILKTNPIDIQQEKKQKDNVFQKVSEPKLIATGMIRLYQLFISTQDIPACNFQMSCSRFGMASIQKYGVFFGILMTADRLLRCNGIGKKYYPLEFKSNLAIDYPVETYYLGKSP